jgi:hypothetical protein
MPHSGSFSEQIEEIRSAFPAVLDCATCRTPQIAKHDGPGEKGSDRAALLPMSLNLRLVVQHCAQQRSMHFDLSIVADETQLAELVHEKTDA